MPRCKLCVHPVDYRCDAACVWFHFLHFFESVDDHIQTCTVFIFQHSTFQTFSRFEFVHSWVNNILEHIRAFTHEYVTVEVNFIVSNINNNIVTANLRTQDTGKGCHVVCAFELEILLSRAKDGFQFLSREQAFRRDFVWVLAPLVITACHFVFLRTNQNQSIN